MLLLLLPGGMAEMVELETSMGSIMIELYRYDGKDWAGEGGWMDGM